MSPGKEEAWVPWDDQECFAAQNSVRVRKHRQEMIYSGERVLAEKSSLRKNGFTDPVTWELVLNDKQAFTHQRRARFRIFQAEETLYAAGSQETPLPTLGIKSIMELREADRKRQEMKLGRWQTWVRRSWQRIQTLSQSPWNQLPCDCCFYKCHCLLGDTSCSLAIHGKDYPGEHRQKVLRIPSPRSGTAIPIFLNLSICTLDTKEEINISLQQVLGNASKSSYLERGRDLWGREIK